MINEKIKIEGEGVSVDDSVFEVRETELSEDEMQTNHENACRELFIRDWVTSSALTPEQKVFVANYVNSKPGAWREYNGKDFKVIKVEVEQGMFKIVFGVFFDDYEAQRIDVEVPLAG
jgi:hypothetical protein